MIPAKKRSTFVAAGRKSNDQRGRFLAQGRATEVVKREKAENVDGHLVWPRTARMPWNPSGAPEQTEPQCGDGIAARMAALRWQPNSATSSLMILVVCALP